MNTTEGRLYITALKSLERLDIQFVPKDLNYSRSPNIAAIEVIGRNNPLYHYTGGTTDLSFELDFHAEETNREDVMRRCKWLESLTYSDGYAEAPEQIKLTFGSMFRKGEVWIIKSFKAKYDNFNAANGFLPQQAMVQLTLSLDPKVNLTREDIRWQ